MYKELLHKAIDDIESESRLCYLFGIANKELVKEKTQNKKEVSHGSSRSHERT